MGSSGSLALLWRLREAGLVGSVRDSVAGVGAVSAKAEEDAGGDGFIGLVHGHLNLQTKVQQNAAKRDGSYERGLPMGLSPLLLQRRTTSAHSARL
jgi:hypothetical protein